MIFSKTVEEQIERLESVFRKLRENGLKLKGSKCEFFRKEIKYMGFVVSEDGIKTDEVAERNWPEIYNIKGLRRFLGFTSYYRKFIKDYAKIVRPLNDFLVGHHTNKKGKNNGKGKGKIKPVKWNWGQEQQVARERLIEVLTSPPILAYADYSLPFLLDIDASGNGLGAVLHQRQNGIDRVVAYASRALRAAEKLYPAHKREFLGLSGQLRINSMIIYMEIRLKFVRIIILSHMYWVKLNSMLHHKGG